MYKVKMDGQTLYYPGDKEAALINPVLTLSVGYAGTFEFMVTPQNPLYDKIKNRQSMVSVIKNGTEIFYGEVRKHPSVDRYRQKNVYCTGAMSFLADSIQPQAEYHEVSPRRLLGVMLDHHNSQVEERKKIHLGVVSITDTNDSLYRMTNYETTLKAIREKLVDKLGGYLRLRHEKGKLYLDWITLEEYGKYCQQPIEFGMNLMDYTESVSAENVVTALIPLGAKVQDDSESELEQYVDITSVNGGLNYIYDTEAVKNFGWVWTTNNWDDVTVPSNLLRKGKQWLKDNQFEEMTLSLTAVDLSEWDAEYDAFDIGDRVKCRAKPYGMDRIFPVMEMSIPLQRPDEARLTLGNTQKRSYTESQAKNFSNLSQETEIRRKLQNQAIKDAIDNLTAKMTGSAGGYKLSEYDENGLWIRDLYMDAPNKEDATNILQINKDGIGGTRNGYEGPYTVGMTLDGHIIGERITANSIDAEKLSVEYKTEVESKISEAGEDAKEYTDEKEKAVRETITTSIKSVEDQIGLSVSSVKDVVEKKNYVVNGEQEAINLSAFTIEGNFADLELTEYLNMRCIKVTFRADGVFYLTQDLGTLAAGTYDIAFHAAFPEDGKPSYLTYGVTNYMNIRYLTTFETEKFHVFERSVTVSKGKKDLRIGVCGTAGKVMYITNIRCLRDIQQLLNDLRAEINVGIGEVSARVTEVYGFTLHDYIKDGSFSGNFSGNWTPAKTWYRNDTSKVYSTIFKGKRCGTIHLGNGEITSRNYYLRSGTAIKIPQKETITIRFQACAKSNGRIKCYFYNTNYVENIGSSWEDYEITIQNVPEGEYYLHFYNAGDSYVCITEVELLGKLASYAESQLTLHSDAITAEVKRASEEEKELKASIEINADKIKQTVKKGEFGSYVTQYYNKVIYGFNNNSKYVQINPGAISIYNNGVSDSKKRAVFDQNGNHFYRDGYYVGKIGTNQIASNHSRKGLDFDLEPNGAYMTWGRRRSGSDIYAMKWTYVAPGKEFDGYDGEMLHAGCNIDMHNWKILNPQFEGGGINGTLNFIQIASVDSSGKPQRWANAGLTFKNGILVSGHWATI